MSGSYPVRYWQTVEEIVDGHYFFFRRPRLLNPKNPAIATPDIAVAII